MDFNTFEIGLTWILLIVLFGYVSNKLDK